MPTFTFSEYDVGNTLLVPDDGGPSLAISTTRSNFTDQPQLTTIQVVVPGAEGTVLGALDWKNKTVEIAGVRKPKAEVKHKPGGAFSL